MVRLPQSALALLLLTSPAPLAAQLPAGWKVLPDASTYDASSAYVQMPPGWHMTAKGSGATIYDPSFIAGGRYGLEWSAFVFPDTKTDPFGIFIGGKGLDGPEPTYLAIQLTAQGIISVSHRVGRVSRVVVPATAVDNFVKPLRDDPGLNTMRVTVEADSVRITVNGQRATAFASTFATDGLFGFRVGDGANLHVSRLDRITPLAPPPAPRPATGGN